MTKHCFILIFAFLLQLLTYSCSDANEVPTYAIASKDFEDILYVEGLVEPVKSTTVICPRNVNEGTIAFLAEDGAFVKKGDTICIIEDLSREAQYEKLLNDMEKEEARLAKARVDSDMEYALLEAQVKNNEVNANLAQLDSLQLVYASSTDRRIKELELKKVEIEREKHNRKLQTLDAIQKSDIKKIELRIDRLSNRISHAKGILDELIIKAPQDGLIVRSLNYDTEKKLLVGDIVWRGMPLISIPEVLKMKVNITASESDYKSIKVGDSVRYIFDAMPDNIGYGKIIKKAPMGRTLNKKSKVKFFDIESAIDSIATMPDPGFTADCRILLRQVKDTIVVPQIAIFEEDSMKIAYVKTKRGFEKRQILTGLTSLKEAIISAGLKRNEVIALLKPPSSMVVKTVILTDSIAHNKQKQ